MCLTPNQLSDGTLVACRECWQCCERKILDWSGRCIAESKTSAACSFVTMTYGRGQSGKNAGKVSHERAHVLTFSDVQKFFKRLRKDGFAFSYFVCGEYGGEKGRSHWHAIIYWHGDVPKHELRRNKYTQEHWHHGFSYWDDVTPSTVRYVCKYVQKNLNDLEAQGHLSMSKKPPLGSRYFAERAQKFVDAGLAPQDLFYTFDEARDQQGKKLKFMLGGRSAELFLTEYLHRFRGYPDGWHEKGRKVKCFDAKGRLVGLRTVRIRGFQGPPCPVRGWHYPPSVLVEEFEDKGIRDLPLSAAEVDQAILSKERKIRPWQETRIDPDAPVEPERYVKWRSRARDYAIRMQDVSMEI